MKFIQFDKSLWTTSLVMAMGILLATSSLVSAQNGSSYNGWAKPNDDLTWHTDLESAKKIAADQNKLLLLHFTATWCRPCKTLETFVFSSTEVQNAMSESVVAVKVDADEHQELVSEFGVTQVPFDIIMTAGGKVVSKRRSPKDVRNYVHMLTKLNATNKSLRENSEGSLANRTDYSESSLTGTQQAPFQAKGPQLSPVGISADSTFLANRSKNYQPETSDTVRKNPFVDAASEWQDRESMERKSFLDKQQLDRIAQPTAPPTRRPPQIINNQFFDQAAAPESMQAQLPEPQISDMIAANNIEGRFEPAQQSAETAATVVNDSEFQMPTQSVAGQSPTGGTSFVAANTSHQSPAIQPETAESAATKPETNQATTVDRSKFCLQGKCPVTLLKEGRWEDGDAKFGIVHRDRVYIFASAECLEEFKNDPDGYSPVLAGYDPVVFHEEGKLADGLAQHGVFMGSLPNQRVVLFGSAETRAKFQSDPHAYLDTIRQAMNQADGAVMR